jgi:membrane-associated protease RseP (regulator of RpoE activity)
VTSVLQYILGIVIVAVGVLLSIVLHEAGHFTFAKIFKVRVGQFMVGFGKTLWSRKIGETEFGIKALPLGGYISMSGMYPPIKPGGRARTASTGFFQTLVQDAGEPAVDAIDPEPTDQDERSGFLKSLVQDARDASAQTILPGREDHVFYKLAIWKRIIIMLGGPFMNLVIASVLYLIIICGMGVGVLSPTVSAVPACVQPVTLSGASASCTSSDTPSPAAEAGFRVGDKIESVNGKTITSWAQVTKIIQASTGKTLHVVVLRDGKDTALTAVPAADKEYVYDSAGKNVLNANGTAKTKAIGFLGIDATETLKPQSVSYVLPTVWTTTTKVGGIVINLPQRLVGVWNAAFSSAPRDPNGPIGLVGVGRIAGQITTDGSPFEQQLQLLLTVLASLNIALFVFNLIPLMPLDGGHIIGAIWEGVKRGIAKLFHRRDPGPVDTAKVVPLTFAVVVVLGAMSLLLLYADIVNPVVLPQ